MKLQLPKIEFNSPVIIWYTLLSFLVLMFGVATGNQVTDAFFTCYRTEISDPLMWVRMVTYVFGHADMAHYTSNFFLIILLGPMMEEKYGSKALLVMLLITALVGGAANVLLTTAGLRGASGIAFMLIILCSCTTVQSGKVPLTMVLVVIIYIGKELVSGITTADNISHMTHILGGICGIGFGMYFNQKQAQN